MAKIALLVASDYQDLELWYPYLRLKEAGHEALAAGCGAPHYKGKHGYPIDVDCDVEDLDPSSLAGVVIPGGWAPDRIRLHPPAVELVRSLDSAGKVVAAICHAGSVLVSADICNGRELTSYRAIRDDLVHAGARWVDREVVRDGNLITSRKPADLPAFMRTVLAALQES